jgi:hypothetical protein
MSDHRDSWNGRPVTFAEFTIRTGRAIIDAFGRDAQEGSFRLLVESLHYADDNTAVFASLDDIYDQPFRLNERIAYLAGKCAQANGLRGPDEPEVKTNGAASPETVAAGEFDGTVGPSH